MPQPPQRPQRFASTTIEQTTPQSFADDADTEDLVFHRLGVESIHQDRLQTPSFINVGRGRLICCGLADITCTFLSTLQSPCLVVSCMDIRRYERDWNYMREQVRSKARASLKTWNVSYARARDETFFAVILPEILSTINEGGDVIIHCHAGRHRAPMAFCCILMFLQKRSFQEAADQLRAVRNVDLNGIVHGRWISTEAGTWRMTENHMETWIYRYENMAATGQYMAMVSENERSSEAASADTYPSTTTASTGEVSASQLQQTGVVTQPHSSTISDTDSDEQYEYHSINEPDAARWLRFQSPDCFGLWWWQLSTETYFCEGNPESGWQQYIDPATYRFYWYRDDNNWFFTNTGHPE